MEATGMCIKPPRKRKKKKAKTKSEKLLHTIEVEDLDVPLEDQTFQDAASIVVSEITDHILYPLPDNLAEETLSLSLPDETKAKDSHFLNEFEKNGEATFVNSRDEAIENTEPVVVKKSELKIEEMNTIIESSEYTSAEIETKNSILVIEYDPYPQTSQPMIVTESENTEKDSTPLTSIESDCNIQHTDTPELKQSHEKLELFPSIAVDEYKKLLHDSIDAKQKVQEKEAMHSETLKPSVFVGKGRPYSSSLEIGYQWDRTKYNPVLLPDLTKVVYPDLDSFFTKVPTYKLEISPKKEYTIIEEEETILPSERLAINRLTKPKLKAIIEKHKEKAAISDMNQSNSMPDSDAIGIDNQTKDDAAQDNHEKLVKPKPKPFVDYIKNDGLKRIRIFMNPLVWDPYENQQLVVFEVDSIFYEEFFTDCKTQAGLLKAIMERADDLSNKQQRLGSLSKRKWNSKTKEFDLQNSATLTIYGCPLKWKQKKNKQRVLFKVNSMYHEEEYVNCGSLEGLLEAVMTRAESLGRHQGKLKERALELLAAWSLSYSNNYESLEMMLNENDGTFNTNVDDFGLPNESLKRHYPGTSENVKIYPPPRATKNVFTAMRKWWKGTFGKESVQHRDSEPTLSQSQTYYTDDTEYDFPSSEGRARSSVVSSSQISTRNDSSSSTSTNPEIEFGTLPNVGAVANENHPFSQDVPRRPNRTTFGNLFRKK